MQQHLMETQIEHEQQILDAIDQLRKRKARPDAERICNFLLRKYSVDACDTIEDLHRLIEVEKVIQVDYKGHTSYRNASKWSRLQLYKNRPEGFVKEKLNSSMVSSAVSELVVEEPDYLDQGVPAGRLIEQLLDGVSSPTSRRMVEEFLNKEVSCGNLARLSNGNYSLVATSDMTTPATSPEAARRDSATTSSTDVVAAAAAAAAAVAAAAVSSTTTSTTNASHLPEQNGNATTRRVGKKSSVDSTDGSTAATATTTATISTTAITRTMAATATQAVDATAAAAAELYEFDETDNFTIIDSRSNTPRLSRQASPKSDQQQDIKKEECYEIIVGKKDARDSVSPSDVEMGCIADGEREHDSLEIAESMEVTEMETSSPKQSPKFNNSDVSIAQTTPNLKRSSKAERKQRLFARTDDPMDIKFEDDPRDTKEELESLKEKREEADRRSSDDREDEETGRSSTNASPTPSNANAAGFRSARRKRAKKVFDPSDNNLVKRKRGRQPSNHNKNSVSQDSQDSIKTAVKDGPCRQCSLCAKEKLEALVACRDCTVRAHPSCIYSPEELLQKANYNWQCERCKTCTVCCETSDAGPLVTCFTCDEAYHYYCHTPRVTIPKSNSKWYCNDCLQKQYKATVTQNISSINANRPDTPSNTPVLPPVLSPQVSPTRGSDQMEEDAPKDKIDPNIPDASDWTSEQVYQYFARLFPKEAEVFRQQDIDGHSLLMMKRSDVLTGLDLLLGPALKIYRHVLKLQVRRDDPKLYWL